MTCSPARTCRQRIVLALFVVAWPVVAHARDYQWQFVFPDGANHYGWGYQDYNNGSTNWLSAGNNGLNFPFNRNDNAAVNDEFDINDTVTGQVYIDLYESQTSGPPVGYNFNLNTLDLEPNHVDGFTIEGYNGSGSLHFFQSSSGADPRIFESTPGNHDDIACLVQLDSGAPLQIYSIPHGGADNRTRPLLISGPIQGSPGTNGTSIVVSDLSLTLSGNNSQGTTVLRPYGTLFVSSGPNLGAAGDLVDFQGGTLHPTGSFPATQSVATESAGGNLILDSGISLNLGGTMSGSGVLNVSGAGALALELTAASTGNLSVNSSILSINNSVSLSSASATVSLAAAATVVAAGSSLSSHTVNAHVILFGPTTFNIATGFTVTSGGLVDGNGTLNKIGSGTLVLGGANSFTGGANVKVGTLQVTSDAGNIALTTYGGTSFGGAGAQTIFSDSATAGTATVVTNGGSVIGAAGGVTIFQDSSTLGAATIITNGGILISGGGGVTEFVFQATGGTAKVITNTGGTFDISDLLTSGLTTGSIEGDGRYILGSKSLAFGSLNSNTTVSGVMSDGGGIGGGTGGSIVKEGAGTTTLSGVNTYTGTTTVNAGALKVSGSIATNSAAVVNAGGTLNFISSANGGSAPITVNGAAAANSAPAGRLQFMESSTAGGAIVTTYGGSAMNAIAALTTFTENSTAASATLITNGGTNGGLGGTTSFAGNATGGTARIVTNTGGTFDISQSNLVGLTAGSIAGAGRFNLGSKTLTFGSLGTNTVVSGLVADGGLAGGAGASLVKVGAGTTIFRGNNTYTGATLVNAGMLQTDGAIYPNSLTTTADGATSSLINGASAGATVFTNNGGVTGGQTDFNSGASAGSSTFVNRGGAANGAVGGFTQFSDNGTTAATGVFVNSAGTVGQASGGQTIFNSGATAGNGTFISAGGTASNAGGGQTLFTAGGDAGRGTFFANGGTVAGAGGGLTQFSGSGANAGLGFFTTSGGTANGANGGQTLFFNGASAYSATFTTNGGTSNGAAGGQTVFNSGSFADQNSFTNDPGSALGAGAGRTIFNPGTSAIGALFTNNGTIFGGTVAGETDFNGDNSGGANAGASFFYNNGGRFVDGPGGVTQFSGSSATAATSTFNNSSGTVSFAGGGQTIFLNGATAGGGIFNNSAAVAAAAGAGQTTFLSGALAGSGRFLNFGAVSPGEAAGSTSLSGSQTSAGSGIFTNYAGTGSGGTGGQTTFTSGATAGTGTFLNNGSAVAGAAPGSTLISGSGTNAGSGSFTNFAGLLGGTAGGQTTFNAGASGGTAATITSMGAGVAGALPGTTQLSDANTTAGGSSFIAGGATVSGGAGGQTVFNSGARGGSALMTANGGTASGAGSGMTIFNDGSITDAATLVTNGGTNGGSGGLTEAIGNVTGGTNQVITNAGGTFDISQLSVDGLTVGSIEGAGTYDLGSRILTFGSLGGLKTVSGVISDGGLGGGSGGSIVKNGSGTTTFSGTNTYSGGTILNSGALNINSPNAIGTGPFAINGGTIDNTTSGPITLATNNAEIWAGSFTFAGTQSLNFGSGAVTLNSNPTVTVLANTLTVGPIGNGTGNSLTKAGAGTLFVAGGASYTGTTAVNVGTMTVSGGPFASSRTTVAGAATMNFINAANAGSGTFVAASTSAAATAGGLIQFFDASTRAGSANYTVSGAAGTGQSGGNGGNGATMIFNSGSSGDHATIGVQGASNRNGVTSAQVLFNVGSTGGNAMITTSGGTDSTALGGLTQFSGGATAGAATLVTNGGSGPLPGQGGVTQFKDTASGGAAMSTINSGAFNKFLDWSSAGSATITVNGGGTADFENNATAGSASVAIASNGLATFKNSASGGSAAVIAANPGAAVEFHNNATLGSSTINYSGSNLASAHLSFFDSSDGGGGHINNLGAAQAFSPVIPATFYNSSSASGATIVNGDSAVIGASGGETDFVDTSSAGHANISNAGTSTSNGTGGVTKFSGAAMAGTATITNSAAATTSTGGSTIFNSGTSADHATIMNNGSSGTGSGFTAGRTTFNSGSTAGNATLSTDPAPTSTGHAGEIDFNAAATAGNSSITNNGAGMSGAAGGLTQFASGDPNNLASAGSATITANGGTASGAGGGLSYFTSYSTAASATVTANGGTASGALGATTRFDSTASAGSATLIANGGTNGGAGGLIRFFNGPPSGETARVIVNAGGTFQTDPSITVGSIEGAGQFVLGGATLTSGSLNTDTTVSGVISGGSASIGKQGTGKLSLTGANTYTGVTTAAAGTLSTNLLANGGSNSGIGASSNAASNLVLNGGTFQYTGPTASTDRLFTVAAAGGALDASGTGPVTFSNSSAVAFSGSGPRTLTLTGSSVAGNTFLPLVGDGSGGATSLTKSGSGTWVLNTLNTYTGITAIAAGTLRYGGSDIDPSTNIQAYTLSPANPTPNWNFGGSLGMDFNVNSGKSITITQLGLFAASQNTTPFQFSAAHTVYIYQRNDSNNSGTVLTSLNLSASAWNAAPLSADGFRFVALPTPLTLGAGTYAIVAEAFGTDGTDKYFDLGSVTNNSNASAGTTNTGLGAVSFVGDSRHGSTGNYPSGIYFWPFAYGAGSFDYTLPSVPAVGRIPGDVTINGSTATLDLGNNQTGYVGTVTLDRGGSIIGTGTSRLTSRTSFQMKSGTVTAILAGAGIPLVKSTTGIVTLSGADTFTGGTTVNGGTLIVGHVNALGTGALTINSGAQTKLQAGLTAPVQLTSLTIAGGTAPMAALDVTDNNMVMHGGSIGTTLAQLKSGLNASGTLWTGNGIQSSTAAANAATNSNATVFAVGAIRNVDKNGALIYSTWPVPPSQDGGASGLTTTDVLVKYTYFGDADLNGVVDNTTDYDLWSNGFTNPALATTNGWLYGDFDFSGVVDNTTDYDLWSTGFAHQGGPLSGGGGAAAPASVQPVPEPGAFVLTAIAMIAMFGGRFSASSKWLDHS
jgi:fibronectin-binding autotransporter adhesin